MSEKRIPVQFLKSWRGYSKDEIAGFDQGDAQRLVDSDVAEFYSEDGRPAKGKGKSKGTGKGSSSAATPPAPGTSTADPSAGGNGDGDGGGDNDDNEEKP